MASDIREESLKQPIDVAEYLFRRIHEVGIRGVHGVPGDYNLVALDYLERCGLKWVGNVNELNAGYAADGYARVKGISALLTTIGVGELSAINAVAGAYSEYVPLIHIVGTPSTESQANGMMLHHTLGNGDFNTFATMSRSVACVSAYLTDAATIAAQIDHAIRECWIQSRPVYLTLPMDMVTKKIEGERLSSPLDLSFTANDQEKEDYVVDIILKYLYAAKNPVILVDACTIRHRAVPETRALIEKSGLPTFVTPMGKSAVNESLPNYCGVYAGDGSHDDVRECVENSDLVLTIGSLKTDFNTAGFTYRVSQLSTIDFHSTYTRVKFSEYPGVRMNGVLRKVVDQLQPLDVPSGPTPQNVPPSGDDSETITQDWFWPTMARWLQASDIVITETGTSNFGIWETRFPADVTHISQVLWGSIGYATAACQGAALAAKESEEEAKDGRRQRTILFTGDGSFQLTAQALSTMIRQCLSPIIFVICNDGFTIERLIHGMEEEYNDIQPWRYKDLVSVFGAREGTYKTYSIRTKKEAEALFADREFGQSNCLRFVELYIPKKDAPSGLKITAGIE